MKNMFKILLGIIVVIPAYATNNQTDTLSPILPETGLPFRVVIEQAPFQLPIGLHSGVVGLYKGLWVFIAGSHFGLHGFGPDPFPPEAQNRRIYVVNPMTGVTTSRSLLDPSSGLTQQQIDLLSVISPQGYQESNTLYMTGGYGIDTATGAFTTKPVLTAFNLPGIVRWVMEPQNRNLSVAQNISQLYNPVFQVSGGEMFRIGNVTQLVFGQNFTGVYTPGSSGEYTNQVRRFELKNTGGVFSVSIDEPKPYIPDPNYRRRDLNIVPVLLNNNDQLQYGLVAYSGVFTLAEGVWTVPVVIDQTGNPHMDDPLLDSTFKQGMNHYVCATANLYSKRTSDMYSIFLGGMSYGYYVSGVFQTDAEIPFINQITTVKMDKDRHFTQYFMNSEYPVIISTGANPGNPLLFGSGSYFINSNISQYPNGVINLDNIRRPTVIGYIVGGIQSTLPNTNVDADSSASAYIFKVTLVPVQ